MKIVHLSDTFNFHDQVLLPDGDILIHSGNFTNKGSKSETTDFFDFLKRISDSYQYIIFIAGHSDKAFDLKFGEVDDFYDRHSPYWEDLSSETVYVRPTWLNNLIENLPSNVYYLQDKTLQIQNVKFYGSPWSPWESGLWAFNAHRGSEIAKNWNKIPKDTNILITHCPPQFYCDYSNKIYHGCEDLRKKVKEIKPQLHLFGHIPDGYGRSSDNHTIYANASLVASYDEKMKSAMVFNIDKDLNVEVIEE